MNPSGAAFFLILFLSLVALGVLYVVIRLAVTHALRAVEIWRHDGRFAEALEERKRDIDRLAGRR